MAERQRRSNSSGPRKGLTMDDVQNIRQRFRQRQVISTSGARKNVKTSSKDDKPTQTKPVEQEEPTEFERIATKAKPALSKMKRNKSAMERIKTPTPKSPVQVSETRKTVSGRKDLEARKSESRSRSSSNSCSSPSPSRKSQHDAKLKKISSSANVSVEKKPTKESKSLQKTSTKKEASATSPPPTKKSLKPNVVSFSDLYTEEFDLSSPGASYLRFTPPSSKEPMKSSGKAKPKTKDEHTADGENGCAEREQQPEEFTADGTVEATKTVDEHYKQLPEEITADGTVDEQTSSSGLSTSYSSDCSDYEKNSNVEAIAAALHLIDFVFEKNLFAEFLDPNELALFQEFFKGRHGVDEHVLVIFDKMFSKILASESLARNDETQKDLIILNKDKTESKNHLLDALLAKSAVQNSATSPSNRSIRDKSEEINED